MGPGQHEVVGGNQPRGGGWNLMFFKVPSSLSHSMSLVTVLTKNSFILFFSLQSVCSGKEFDSLQVNERFGKQPQIVIFNC